MCTSSDNNVKEVLEGQKKNLVQHQLLVVSSGGIIVPDGYISSENGFVGIMAIGDPDTTVGAGSSKQKDARETGRLLAKEAMEKAGKTVAPAYFLYGSPAEEEDYLKGIEDVIGRVPSFGGSAADNTVSADWSIFTNDKVFSDGCAVAFFYTDKPMANVYTGAYHETTNSGVITKIEGKNISRNRWSTCNEKICSMDR